MGEVDKGQRVVVAASGWLDPRRETACLKASYSELKASGRGKHVGRFSYYHVRLVSSVREAWTRVDTIAGSAGVADSEYNVVKMDGFNRISLLLYEGFEVPFPSLLAAVSCDLGNGSVRRTDYGKRANPPILHRKELLLPENHPLVPEAAGLTARLESLGAFDDATRIGTRVGWQRRLAELGVDASGRRLK